jgi:hypothetical protein
VSIKPPPPARERVEGRLKRAAWRALHQISGRRIRHDLAAVDKDRPRTHRFDFIELVRRDQDRLRLAHPLDEAAHRDLLVRVETVGRLIEDQHRRVVHNRPGQRDATAIALGQSLDRPRQHVCDCRVFRSPRDGILRTPARAGRACVRGTQESPSPRDRDRAARLRRDSPAQSCARVRSDWIDAPLIHASPSSGSR